LLLFAQTAPVPPQTFMPEPVEGQVVLSVQSAEVRQ
jgi:hypothetical protein